MTMNGYATQREIAELLDIKRSHAALAIPRIADFPPFEHIGRLRRYSVAKVKAWAKGKDVKAIVADKIALVYAVQAGYQPSLFNQRAQQFLRGRFASAEQRHHHELKKLVARQCGHQILYRVSINWSDQ